VKVVAPVITIAVLLAAPIAGTSAKKKKPPPYSVPTGVTIAAAPAIVTFGQASALTGKVTSQPKAGVTVTLQSTPFPYTAPFKGTATALTDQGGGYRFTVSPGANTRYRVEAKASPTVTSPVVGVRVRVKVSIRLSDSTPARGHLVRFSGLVLPAHNGKVARIQRHTSSGWRTVARTTLRATTPLNGVARSRYSKRIRIRASATYRVRVSPADGDHVTGTSRTRSVRVH
jgi:hypothetical protein